MRLVAEHTDVPLLGVFSYDCTSFSNIGVLAMSLISGCRLDTC